VAHVRTVQAAVLRASGKTAAAVRCLREAVSTFEQLGEPARAAAALLDLAQGMSVRSRADAEPTFRTALRHAREARRPLLVDRIERAWQAVGRASLPPDWPQGGEAGDLGRDGMVLVLQLRLPPGVEEDARRVAQGSDLLADVAAAWATGGLRVWPHAGHGLIAVVRSAEGRASAVKALVDAVRLVQRFNRPRQILKWPTWQVFAVAACGAVHPGRSCSTGPRPSRRRSLATCGRGKLLDETWLLSAGRRGQFSSCSSARRRALCF
jgi:hypothetical protein